MKKAGWHWVLAMALCAATSWGAATNVLCTVFPIYQITRNVAEGRAGVEVQLLLPAAFGCPHDYALTPRDMHRLARADVLVVNGLGLEEFLGAPVETANPRLRIVDASSGIDGVIEVADEDGHGVECEHDHEGEHGHAGGNPHLFASPRMSAKLAMNLAAELSKVDPEGAGTYAANAQAYAERMNALADEMAEAGRTLRHPRIAQPHGAFDYLARDMGLEIVATLQPHGQELSAADMLAVVETLKEKKAGAVFTEPQYPSKAGQTLAREAGIPVAELDPGASGPEDAPLDHAETTMRRNMEILVEILGTRE